VFFKNLRLPVIAAPLVHDDHFRKFKRCMVRREHFAVESLGTRSTST
jgi:hypothetical protein